MQAGEDEEIVWKCPGSECPVAEWAEKQGFKYLICQVEQAPSTGQVHLQGYLVLENQVHLGGLKRRFSDTAHWEVRKGNHKQAKDYCSKAETRLNGPWELGDEPKQGERTDVKTIYEMVKAKKTQLEILEATEGASAKFEKALKYQRFILQEGESDRQLQGVRTIVLWGPKGTGKSYGAINFIAGNKDYYILDAPSTKGGAIWFDGYDGQHTLILEDFDGDSVSFAFLKRMLDVYKFKVPIKGGFSWAVWTTVVITSNLHPADWFANRQESTPHIEPIRRRIHEIRHCEHQGTYRRQDWDYHYLDEDFQQYQVPVAPAAPEAPAAVPETQTEESPSQDGYITGPDTQAARQEQRQMQQIVID